MPPLLEISGLTKSYRQRTVLSALDLVVHAGEVVGLLGPNGAGKTTAIECVAGLLRPDGGEVRIAGQAIAPGTPPGAALAGIALQDTWLHDRATALECVEMSAHLAGVEAQAPALLDRFGLGGCANTRYARLSGGQRQSLAVALAFIGNPQLVILDEPTVGLDLGAREMLHRSIAAMRGEGRGVLMATHDLAEAESLCDRVAVVGAGRVLAYGRTAELIRQLCTWSNVIVECDLPLDLRQSAHLRGDLAPATRFALRTDDPSLAMREVAELAAAQERQIIRFETGPASLEDLVRSLEQKQ